MAEIGAVLRKQQNKLGESLVRKTHFTLAEVDCIFTVYRKAGTKTSIIKINFQIQ